MREFKEELGQDPPDGPYIELGQIKQNNNKTVAAWAVEADLDISRVKSNTVKIEWPPKSGRQTEFPEIDKCAYFDVRQTAEKAVAGQYELFKTLAGKLAIELELPEPAQSSLF